MSFSATKCQNSSRCVFVGSNNSGMWWRATRYLTFFWAFLCAFILSTKQKRQQNGAVGAPLNNIVISTDTDQYQGIYCNISAHIAQPWCDLFDRIHRLVRSEALQHRGIGTQLAVSTSDKLNVKCSLYCCRSYHPAQASTSDWEGSVIECFPGLHHTACCTYRKDRQLRTASWMPMIAPHGLPLVSLNQLIFFFFFFWYKMLARMYEYVILLSINWAVNGSFFLFTNARKHSDTLTSPCPERWPAALAVISSRRLAC